MLTYWHKLTRMDNNSIAKQVFNYIKQNEPEKYDWYSSVKFLLNFIGLNHLFDNPNTLNEVKFKDICKTNLERLMVQQWREMVNAELSIHGQRNKLRLYRDIKRTFQFEPYLDLINDFQSRKKITKIRCSDHNLEIETGRHRRTEIHDRICHQCNGNTESEKHFLLECPCFSSIRRYFGNLHPDSYIDILQCNNKNNMISLSKYLNKALNIRDEMLLLPKINRIILESNACCYL